MSRVGSPRSHAYLRTAWGLYAGLGDPTTHTRCISPCPPPLARSKVWVGEVPKNTVTGVNLRGLESTMTLEDMYLLALPTQLFSGTLNSPDLHPCFSVYKYYFPHFFIFRVRGLKVEWGSSGSKPPHGLLVTSSWHPVPCPSTPKFSSGSSPLCWDPKGGDEGL